MERENKKRVRDGKEENKGLKKQELAHHVNTSKISRLKRGKSVAEEEQDESLYELDEQDLWRWHKASSHHDEMFNFPWTNESMIPKLDQALAAFEDTFLPPSADDNNKELCGKCLCETGSSTSAATCMEATDIPGQKFEDHDCSPPQEVNGGEHFDWSFWLDEIIAEEGPAP